MKARLTVEYNEATGNVLIIADTAGLATAITDLEENAGLISALKELINLEAKAEGLVVQAEAAKDAKLADWREG